MGVDEVSLTQDLQHKDQAEAVVRSYTNNSGRRFGTTGSRAFNNLQNQNSMARNTSHYPGGVGESRVHNIDPPQR